MSSIVPDDDLESTKVSTLEEIEADVSARSQRNRAYLIVLAGSNVGEMHRIEEGETFLGRGLNTTIRFNDDGISRRHARIVQANGQVLIEDLKSANGTLV